MFMVSESGADLIERFTDCIIDQNKNAHAHENEHGLFLIRWNPGYCAGSGSIGATWKFPLPFCPFTSAVLIEYWSTA